MNSIFLHVNARNFPRHGALILGVMLLHGCNYFKQENYDKVSENLEDLKNQVSALASDPSKTADEVKKLREFEYKVFDFPDTTTAIELERDLNKLGKEYWDCFHVERQVAIAPQEGDREVRRAVFRFFCKRQPFTPLRFFIK